MTLNTPTPAQFYSNYAEVLPPPAVPVVLRYTPPVRMLTLEQEQLLLQEAQALRAIYFESKDFTPPRSFEDYQDRCAETAFIEHEIEDALEDKSLVAIVRALFERTFSGLSRVEPTTLQGKAEMQIAAVDSARKLCLLLAQQRALFN